MLNSNSFQQRIIILLTEAPSEIFNQTLNPDYKLHHGSDITRIRLLQTFGGIYLDNDVYTVNNFDKYRHFEMSLGWPEDSNNYNSTLGTMILIANRNARFL